MPASLPLQIQTLGGFQDQVLVVLHITCLRAGDMPVTPGAVRDLFLRMRVPPPANVSNYLGHLRREQMTMQPTTAGWAVTPVGLERIRQLMVGLTDAQLKALTETATGDVMFGDARHHLIPPELAPADLEPAIARFLQGFPFDRNVFGISRFPRSAADPINGAWAACRTACLTKNLSFHVAADRSVDDSLPRNVAASIWACKFGIAILEDRANEGLNYNVIFEVGAMTATGRRCLLLKDLDAPPPPTDLVGHIYVEVDIGDAGAVQAAVEKWISESWGL